MYNQEVLSLIITKEYIGLSISKLLSLKLEVIIITFNDLTSVKMIIQNLILKLKYNIDDKSSIKSIPKEIKNKPLEYLNN